MHWRPSADRREEAAVAKRLRASSKFYRFLWEIREDLFDEAFETLLYRGVRKNELDTNRAAVIANLHVLAGFRASAWVGVSC